MSCWRNSKIILSGEKDGFKWYVGEYDLPFSLGNFVDPSSLKPSTSSIVRLAYVDVTGTKLDGITSTSSIDDLGIDLYCGCTFAGAIEDAMVLKNNIKDGKWFIGEDYAHGSFEDPIPPEDIAKHLESETIPSIIKALVTLDVKDLIF